MTINFNSNKIIMKGFESAKNAPEEANAQREKSRSLLEASELKIKLLEAVTAKLTPVVRKINELCLKLALEQSQDNLAAIKNGSIPIKQKMVTLMRNQLVSADAANASEIRAHLRKIDPTFEIEEAISIMIQELKSIIERIAEEYDPEPNFFASYIPEDIQKRLTKV